MNTYDHVATCVGLAAIVLSLSAPASGADNDGIDSYQQNALFHPSSNQLRRESQGFVYIYDEMTDKTIDKAMDDQPERIQSMMFVNTKMTDENGNPLRDAETGEILVADDDC